MLWCIGAFNLAIAPLTWLIMSEIFPTRLRARAVAVASFTLWACSFVSNQIFAPMIAFFEKHLATVAPAFFLFAVVCAVTFVFGWSVLPETKGKSLEEIGRWWLPRAEGYDAPP